MLVEYLSKTEKAHSPQYYVYSFFREIVLSFPGTSLLSLVRKYYPPPAPSQQNRFSSSICFDIKVKTLLRPKTETLIFNHTFFKGQEIAPAEKAKKSKTSKGAEYVYSKLGIGNATEDDSGEYVCVVENHSGQNNNVSVEIKVWTGECVFTECQEYETFGANDEATSIL